MELILLLSTALLYLLLFRSEWQWVRGHADSHFLGLGLSLLACLSHAALLYYWIDQGQVQNLSVFNLLSLVTWMVAVFLWGLSCFQPLNGLWLVMVPLILLGLLFRMLFPSSLPTQMSAHPTELIHLLLAILLVSVFCLAALQALVLHMQQWALKRKAECRWLAKLPAVESMEKLLHKLLWAGFVLLSVVILVSLALYHDRLLQDGKVLRKSLVFVVAWGVFLFTLTGRHWFFWRSQQVTRGVLAGMVLVLLIYLLGL